MTSLQFEMAISFAISAAIIHMIVHRQWSTYFRKKVENNFQMYKQQLEKAKEKVEIIKRLHDEQKCIILGDGTDTAEYINAWDQLIQGFGEISALVNNCLRCDQHAKTKGANQTLKRCSRDLKRNLYILERAIKKVQ